MAWMELNGCPVASTPMVSGNAATPFSSITKAMVKTLEMDWIDTSDFTSPTLNTRPSTVTSTMPKMSESTLARAGI